MTESALKTLFDTVVTGGYCIGCGNCGALNDSPVTIQLSQCGTYQATADQASLEGDSNQLYLKVCPFSELAVNEDTIAGELFGKEGKKHPLIGYYTDAFVGHVNEGEFRTLGSSGGLGTWIVHELLRTGMVDGVVHVCSSSSASNDSPLFKYRISTSLEEVKRAAKSRYYPIEMSSVLNQLRQSKGRYVVVGLPCFVKAVRLICGHDIDLSSRIAYTVALFCGHLKSTAWGEMLAWQCGITPDRLLSIDFRKKLPDRAASDYGVEVMGTDEKNMPISQVRAVSDMYGTDWGLGYFKYKACDYCDDITGETADVAVGDAWLPGSVSDYRGTNVVVVRNSEISKLIQNALREERVFLTRITPNDVVKSQSANFRHRREGLSIRLSEAGRRRQWVPPKRTKPKRLWSKPLFRRRILIRSQIAELSHKAFYQAKLAQDFSLFAKSMQKLVFRYRQTYLPGRLRRLIVLVTRKILHLGRGR